MFNNFIGGGQVFLHKVRMFGQVFFRSFHVSLLVGILLALLINWGSLQRLDWSEFLSYRKSVLAISFSDAANVIRETIGKEPNHISYINARTNNSEWNNINPHKIYHMGIFQRADNQAWDLLTRIGLLAASATSASFVIIFLLWSRFGSGLKDERKNEGSGCVLTAGQVRSKLRSLDKCSRFSIGKMPLVKDMETRHFLVTGSTGSGKTNLIHNLLPQVEKLGHPAIVIDQTGEMIAKYYNPERGDIIFNPFDSRGRAWDFWADCGTREDLERFSKILIGFNRKQSSTHSDPFWENAAEAVFNSCIEFLRPTSAPIEKIAQMVCHSDINYLKRTLNNTEAGRYLSADSKQTAASIVSVLAVNAKPLTYLRSADGSGSFSMKQHFANIKNGSPSWLFLATKPSSRSLTLPLISCLTELALARLMDSGIHKDRRVWTVIDELPALGLLPALSPLMAEGRKYGACVLAGMQSLNQLYSQYGHYDGSTIFGQFGTSFFFRNTEPAIAKMISSMCGSETITRQQKNTSFGANEFRDGVSYSEQQQRKSLVEADDLASLAIGECYVLFPEPAVRLAKIQTKEVSVKEKHQGFVEKEGTVSKDEESASSEPDNLAIENIENDEDINDSSTSSHSDASADGFSRLEVDIHTKNEGTEFEK
ncbi:MAG: type IV secretion system DNA-binding domain-containing protein [Sphingobacteriaceae bacterium]|nr:type IV secretion system DNA-binding domain-containing protein [Sphingobacteriaceae bacterium]